MDRKAVDFASLSKAGYPVQRFPAGTTIFAKGDEGDSMYIVCSGSVRLELDGRPIEEVGANGTFGEMSLIDGSKRSAAAVTAEDSELAILNKRAFVFLVHETPYFALDVMATMAARLRRMNSRV